MNRELIRGDDYGVGRYLFRYALVTALGAPYDLTGCRVDVTYKAAITDPGIDPTDSTATVKHTLIVTSSGVATTTTGLYLVGSATAGVVEERMTRAETLAMPLTTNLLSDLQLTDARGEVTTFLFTDTISARDGITNRTGA